jgi:hypothetical protein
MRFRKESFMVYFEMRSDTAGGTEEKQRKPLWGLEQTVPEYVCSDYCSVLSMLVG